MLNVFDPKKQEYIEITYDQYYDLLAKHAPEEEIIRLFKEGGIYDEYLMEKKRKETLQKIKLSDDEVLLKSGIISKKKDAVKIGSYWYDKDDSDVAKDFVTDKYILKSRACKIVKAINGDTPSKYGYTYSPGEHFPIMRNGDHVYRVDLDVIRAARNYKESLKDGTFYHKDYWEKYVYPFENKRNVYRKHKCNIDFSKLTLAEQYNVGIKSPSYTITEGKKYTFGVEIETAFGYLPQHYDHKLNYSAEHDGSLRDENNKVNGGEYVTGVLVGDTGMKQLKMLLCELSKRCLLNNKCSVHVHFGGVDFNKEFIVYFYKLALMIEEELFSTLPPSRRNNEYCRKIKPFNINLKAKRSAQAYDEYIDKVYNQIVVWASNEQNYNPAYHNKKQDHPMGFKCQYDHKTARYCWLNIIPALFNTRKNEIYTVEVRSHGASLNYNKIRNWILIGMAMIYVTENYKKFIAESEIIKLEDIISLAFPKKVTELIDYVNDRKRKFAIDADEEDEYRDVTTDDKMKIKEL